MAEWLPPILGVVFAVLLFFGIPIVCAFIPPSVSYHNPDNDEKGCDL